MGLLDLVSYGDWNYDKTAARQLQGILGKPGGGFRGSQVHEAMQNGGLLTNPGTGFQGGQSSPMEAAGQIYNMASNRFNPIASQMLQEGGQEAQQMLTQKNAMIRQHQQQQAAQALQQERLQAQRQAASLAAYRSQIAATLAHERGTNTLSGEQLGARQQRYKTSMKPVEIIENAVRNTEKLMTSGTGASDYAILNSFMKAILPGEAIMEGDVARAQGLTGMYNQLKSQFKSMSEGTTLQPEDRENMINTMQTLLETAQRGGQITRDFWASEEQEFGVPGRITGASPVDFSYKPNFTSTDRNSDPGWARYQELKNKRKGGR